MYATLAEVRLDGCCLVASLPPPLTLYAKLNATRPGPGNPEKGVPAAEEFYRVSDSRSAKIAARHGHKFRRVEPSLAAN